jgi:hypothetical protein
MALRQPDDQIVAVEVAVKGNTAHHAGSMQSDWVDAGLDDVADQFAGRPAEARSRFHSDGKAAAPSDVARPVAGTATADPSSGSGGLPR